VKPLFLFVLIALSFFPSAESDLEAHGPPPNVIINIDGLRNDKGQIAIGIFKNDYNFQNELPDDGFLFDKADMVDGKMTIQFYLPPGETYGVAYLDDENDDRVMNYNWLGLPKEGFGMGGHYPGGLFKPSFEDFSFFLPAKKVLEMPSEVRYIL